MILTKCISSLEEKYNQMPVEGLSYDVTVRLFSSQTSLTYNAVLVFSFPENTRLWIFYPILFRLYIVRV